MSTPSRLRPKFLIIGAQKSGTTALWEYLSHHPEICAPKQKELNYFICAAIYARGVDSYHDCFPLHDPTSAEHITFDASVNYLISEEAASRIHSYDPNMKLIALLRDPVLRAYSAWQMYRVFFQDNRDWYFDWMDKYDAPVDRELYARRSLDFGSSFRDDILEELRAADEGKPVEAPFLRHGFYEEQLQNYRKYFPQQQMFIEDSRRFRDETITVLGEVEDFLEIARHDWDEDLVKPVYVDVRGREQESYEESRDAYTVTVKAKRAKVAAYNGLPSDRSVDLLKGVYDERNRKLFALLGREFSWL